MDKSAEFMLLKTHKTCTNVALKCQLYVQIKILFLPDFHRIVQFPRASALKEDKKRKEQIREEK